MTVSVFDLFKIGIGPSSSHTMGPMKAARKFALTLKEEGLLGKVNTVRIELYGSLGATGKGHGSDMAVMMGLEGETPEHIDPDTIPSRLVGIRRDKTLKILGEHSISFEENESLFLYRRPLPDHPNGMTFAAFDKQRNTLREGIYYSIGGGFITEEPPAAKESNTRKATGEPYPFFTARELIDWSKRSCLPISGIVMENEKKERSEKEIRQGIIKIWKAMRGSITRGCESKQEFLPGPLKVRRRAPKLYQQLHTQKKSDPLTELDWAMLYAIAVNEENASQGRVVTAPTNGAAGILPAVLAYYLDFRSKGADKADREDKMVRFLLTATAIGTLFKYNASISGAEVGCQGEVGSACSMAAGALAEIMGGTPEQVENAAEIGMEHNLGLTCDPIGGLVQIPCIERNAIATSKAITATRIALAGDSKHHVSLDQVIKTMWETGKDMKFKYKETARGGLAMHGVGVSVNSVDC